MSIIKNTKKRVVKEENKSLSLMLSESDSESDLLLLSESDLRAVVGGKQFNAQRV